MLKEFDCCGCDQPVVERIIELELGFSCFPVCEVTGGYNLEKCWFGFRSVFSGKNDWLLCWVALSAN